MSNPKRFGQITSHLRSDFQSDSLFIFRKFIQCKENDVGWEKLFMHFH